MMILKKSIESLKRTPYKTAGFLLLMIFATAFLSLGASLWQTSLINLAAYEKVFTTVGTVRQKENTLEVSELWDAAAKEYYYIDKSVYDSFISPSVLDFEGANYIHKPQQKPYYGAYNPDLRIMSEQVHDMAGYRLGDIIEFTPYDDCIPSEPVKVKVTKVLYGKRQADTDIWLCDHYTDAPVPLEAGKTYVTSIQTYPNMHINADKNAGMESAAYNPTFSTQVSEEGIPIENTVESKLSCVEVTEHFYQTDAGKRWLEICNAMDRLRFHTIPVMPADSLKLLMPFYNGDAFIQTGREISREEFEAGEPVCVIPQNLAMLNGFKVGDRLPLQLYYANYKDSASECFMSEEGGIFNFGKLNADGAAYPVFESNSFEIVGIYTAPGISDMTVSGYEMAYNAVIIPSKAVQGSDEHNIVAYGPMQGFNTSFMIENGSVAAYMEKFNALGLDNLEITFYDGGYEQLASGMRSLEQIAIILMGISVAVTLLIILFFGFIFITKQKRRTAIERSLGLSKRQCAWSLLSGILLVLLVGAAVGSALGYVISAAIPATALGGGTALYSTAFSNWAGSVQQTDALVSGIMAAHPLVPVLSCLAVIFVSLLIILLFVYNSLNEEPMKLLSQNEE